MKRPFSDITAVNWNKYNVTLWTVRSDFSDKISHPAKFSPEIPNRFIQMFTFPNDWVLDPFAGSGMVMREAMKLGRNSISVNVDEYSYSCVEERLKELKSKTNSNSKTKHLNILGDARDLSFLKNDSIDLIVTSPPYFSREITYYNDNPKDLSNITDYEEFKKQLFIAIDEMHRVLKNNHFCIINVADVYLDGNRYHLGVDVFNYAKTLFDERKSFFNIVEVFGGRRGSITGWSNSANGPVTYAPKRIHEYLLVMRKT